MTCTYQLVFGESTLDSDDLQELKDFSKTIKVYWEIFKIHKSDLNEHKSRKITVTEMREIIQLRKKGWTYSGIATRFHCSSTRMSIILNSLNI